MSSSSSSLWHSGVLEYAAGDDTSELAGEGALDILESIAEEESDEDSGGSLFSVLFGRRVSDVVVEELPLGSRGD